MAEAPVAVEPQLSYLDNRSRHTEHSSEFVEAGQRTDLVDLEFSSEQPQAREAEDARNHLSVLCNIEDMEAPFSSPGGIEGKQITHYFYFLRFILATNLLMTVWTLIAWVPHVGRTLPLLDAEGIGPLTGTYDGLTELLFLSTFQPSSDPNWLAMLVLGTATMLLSAPAYYMVCVSFSLHQSDGDCRDDPIRPNLNPTHGESESAPAGSHGESESAPAGSHGESESALAGRRLRRALSWVAFAVLCCVPAGVNFGLLYVANEEALKVVGSIPDEPRSRSERRARSADVEAGGAGKGFGC